MSDVLGVKFINKDTGAAIHTLTDWGCYLHGRQKIDPAPVKWMKESIPGTNGKLDYTKALSGRVNYDSRLIHVELFVLDAVNMWDSVYSAMQDFLHGQTMKIIFDSDSGYYYEGTVEVNEWQSMKKMAVIVIEGDVDPFKYEMFSSLEDWEWDPFNFEDGIIREYKNLTVNASLTLTIPGRRMEVVPTFTVSNTSGNGLNVTYNSVTYHLSEGANRVPAIDLKEGDNVLVFTGSGKVSVDYRGGRF